MAYLEKSFGYLHCREIAKQHLSQCYTCFLFTPKMHEHGSRITKDTNRYRIKCTGVERWEVKDMHENLILNVDYQTKTFEAAYDLLCNHVNNPQNGETDL